MKELIRTLPIILGNSFFTCYKAEFVFLLFFIFYLIFFFHEYSRFTGQQRKEKAISLYPFYHLHSLHRHLDISRVVAAERSPLRIADSRTLTGNPWFPNSSP